MKTTNVRKSMLLLSAFLLILGSFLVPSSNVFSQTGSVVATAAVSDATPTVGDQVTVTVSIDMSAVNAPNNSLGSYTAAMLWNPSVLTYASHTGAPPTGFTGVVNTSNAATGTINFNGANASGATGVTVAIAVTFNVIGGGNAALDLNFTALAAATTFSNLLGILTVNEGTIVAAGGTATGVVELDGTVHSNTAAPTGSSISIPHTTGTGINRLMLVGVSWNCGTTDRTISSIVFDPDSGDNLPLTLVITQQYTWTTNNYRYTAIYRLLNPPVGVSGSVVITFSGAVSNGIIAGVVNFKGVDQTTPLGTPVGAVGTGSSSSGTPNPAVTLTGLNGSELVFDSVFIGASATTHTLTVNSGQAELWNILGYTSSSTSFNTRGSASTKPATAGDVTMGWTTGGYGTTATRWAIAAVPINPAPAGTTFTITASAGTGGSISPTGAIVVNQGANQSFAITPNSGYAIASVLVDSVSQGAISSYTFTNVQAAHTISATFTALPTQYTITASAGAGGSISPTGAVLVNQGANQTFTIAPNSGYVISNVLVDSISQGAISTYTFTNVQAAHTIAASFTTAPVTVTFTGTELLGLPKDTSISVKIVPDANIDLYYEYGTTTGVYTAQTTQTTASAGVPKTVVIGGLNPNTQYFYRMRYRATGGSTFTARAEGSFWTKRAVGSTFTVDITSDSHIDIMLGNGPTWTNTLNKVAADDPDFLFDLGDTVAMYDNVGIGDVAGAEAVYIDTLEYFNIVSDSVPVFVTPGNHENHEGWHYYNDEDSRNIIGVNAQKKFFLNPNPDDFYTGDMQTDANIVPDGYTQAYYAYTWGDALFVVINPYWYTEDRPYQTGVGGGGDDDTANVTKTGDAWTWTLGQEQFEWLKATLEGSNAKYKFVLTHQLVSDGSWTNQEDYGHGGAKTNHIGEWGGYNEDGSTYAWATERPGWGADTVHDIMVDNCVSTVFHGHDHQYAYETRDGVIYTAAPSASFTGNFNGYTVGTGGRNGQTIYANTGSQDPGYIKLTVGPSVATVAYMKTSGTTATHTYTVQPCAQTNTAPTLNPVGNKSVIVGSPMTFTATATDDGLPSGTLSFSLSGSVPAGAGIVAATGVFTWTPGTVGSYTFDVCVSDGALSDCETIIVTVDNSTVPPTQSSFYGEIHYQTGDGVPIAGDFIEAYITGIAGYINRSAILSTGSGLAYTINVDGDDLGTPAKDGGIQNDVVIFKINGRIVATGIWIDMANTQLNIHPPKADAGGPYAVLLDTGTITLAGSYIDWLMSGSFTYAWDFDDDGQYDDATGSTPTYPATQIGTKMIGLKVTDGQGGEGFDDTPLFVIDLTGLDGQVYNGSTHPVTVSGVGAPYSTTVLYGDPASTTPPTNAGTYPVTIQIKEGAVVLATLNVQLVISKATATVNLSNLEQQYDGSPKSVTVTTNPVSLTVIVTYDGSTTPPTNAGSYAVVATVDNANYQGSASGTLQIIGTSHSIALLEGWNLISFNVTPTNTAIADVLSSISGSYSLVYAWDVSGGHSSTGNWIRFDPSVPYGNTLTALDAKTGFWIFMDAPATLTVTGVTQTSQTIHLSTAVGGWNLVGYPSAQTLDLPGVLTDHGVEDFTLVYAYHAVDTADQWKLYDPLVLPILNDLTELSPGWGYWIFVTEAADWQIAY